MKEDSLNHKLSNKNEQSKIAKKTGISWMPVFYYRNKSINSFNTFAIFKKYLQSLSKRDVIVKNSNSHNIH